MAKMTVKTETAKVEVPAGRYYLGDPCYVLGDAKWHELLGSCGYFGAVKGGRPIGTLDGQEVLAFGTTYGDGPYPGVRS